MALLMPEVLVQRLHPILPLIRPVLGRSCQASAALGCRVVGRVDGSSGVRYRDVECESTRREAVGVERRRGLADCARAFRDRTARSSRTLCWEGKVCWSCGKSRRAPVCATYPGAPSWRGGIHPRSPVLLLHLPCPCLFSFARSPHPRCSSPTHRTAASPGRTSMRGNSCTSSQTQRTSRCLWIRGGVGSVGGGCVCYCEAPRRGDTARKDPIFWQFT
ncbi:hypothetical protein B0H13DRAFT_471203 [Mycena leptocephala]|nr:hypothetical protein B0H13DRAFT_471203 [Mycena leptocephala]